MPRILSVNPLVEQVVQLLRPIILNNIELVALFCEEDARVFLDPGQLEQVLVNLAVNARDAMPEGGKLILQTETVNFPEPFSTDHALVPPGAYTVISVTDTGVGMSGAVQERLFEPFFTTKETGKGTGLGLATVYGIVRQAEGHITVYSAEGAGTTFKVFLPRHDDEPIGAPPPENTNGTHGTELILVVEDEPLVRELAVKVLERNGYTVLAAENGQVALRVLAESERVLDLLITDAVMPLMGGREFIERFREIHPYIPIIIASGYSEEGWGAQPQMLAKGITFMQKPFTSRALLERVRQALDVIV
jgi:CheY-like chemotaxis protein